MTEPEAETGAGVAVQADDIAGQFKVDQLLASPQPGWIGEHHA